MLGRALIPLILKDGDKEVQVKEVEELKRLFYTGNLPRLLSALDSGKLEQFFFAKRLDHIKEKIAHMRQNGEDVIEILNYVAEQIGAGKFSLGFERARKRSKGRAHHQKICQRQRKSQNHNKKLHLLCHRRV